MAQDMNLIVFEGNIGRAAEANDDSIFFTMASNRSYKNQAGEWVDKTTWAAVTYYRSTSEKLVAALGKGARVRVTGELNTYTPKGEKISRFNIKASDITFLPTFKRTRDENTDDAEEAPQPAAAAPTRGGRGNGQPRGTLKDKVQRGRRSVVDDFNFDDEETFGDD